MHDHKNTLPIDAQHLTSHSCCAVPHAHHGNHERNDHSNHHVMMMRDLQKRFWISLTLTLPVLLLSPMTQELLHFNFSFFGSTYIALIAASVIYFFGGLPFLMGLFQEVKAKTPGMMTLVAMAISIAYFYSVAITFGLSNLSSFSGHEFFGELAILIDLMLLGHWIEMKSVLGASKALELLVTLLPKNAHLVRGNEITDVELITINVGDIVLVKPGETVPTDGVVIDGASYLNESMLTGESKSVKRVVGDTVIGGAINGNGSLKIQVQHIGKDSYVTKMVTLVQEAQQAKSRTQNLADRAAKWLTVIAIVTGIATFITWLGLGKDVPFALERMVTVMVISCPCALGLAVPLVAAISTTLAAQHGLLIRNRNAFENARKITTLVFDKTGTLTRGNFEVVKYATLSSIHTNGVISNEEISGEKVSGEKIDNAEITKEEMLKLAASVEQYSEHPIARGIVRAAKNPSAQTEQTLQLSPPTQPSLTSPTSPSLTSPTLPSLSSSATFSEAPLFAVENFQAIVGDGVSARISGKNIGIAANLRDQNIKVVSPHYLIAHNIAVPHELFSVDSAETIVAVLLNEEVIGAIVLADEIRPESFAAIKAFQDNHIKTIMLTGDSHEVAAVVSKKLGIDDFYAATMPQQKLEIIKELQTKKRKDNDGFIAMVGDGVNDAPALAQADVGIAIGSGTDIAAATADIILVTNNPKDIAALILFGKATYRKMLQNLAWATCYNIIAIPLAAGALHHYGITLSPAIGAILMSLSTVIVSLNAQTLRKQIF